MSDSKQSRGIAAQIRSLRSDKASGTLTCIFGIIMINFALFGLIAVGFQRVMISAMESMPDKDDGASVIEQMRALHGVWFIYLPIMLVGGIIFAVAGFYLRRGSSTARRVAQANALCGYVWVIAYIISCYQIMDVMTPSTKFMPAEVSRGFQAISMVLGSLMLAAFPSALLLILCGRQNKAS